jgi:hypothetical protein
MTGQEVEALFLQRCKDKGYDISSSSKEENMFQHIDFIVNEVTYDVKAEKRLNRRDEATCPDLIWLEMRNVNGDTGWLCSEVQKIAFCRMGKFFVVDRQKLLDFTREYVGHGEVLRYKEYAKLYSRKGRKDLTCYIWWQDIEHLLEEVI